jgi:hypothetical protein
MPTYDLRNTKTGEIEEHLVSISKKEDMIESGEWEHVHSSSNIVSSTGDLHSKTSRDWNNHLSNIKKTSGRGDTIKAI